MSQHICDETNINNTVVMVKDKYTRKLLMMGRRKKILGNNLNEHSFNFGTFVAHNLSRHLGATAREKTSTEGQLFLLRFYLLRWCTCYSGYHASDFA